MSTLPSKEVKFPLINIQVAPNGTLITIAHSANFSTSVLIDEATSNEWAKQWVLSRGQVKAERDTFRAVMKGHDNGRLA